MLLQAQPHRHGWQLPHGLRAVPRRRYRTARTSWGPQFMCVLSVVGNQSVQRTCNRQPALQGEQYGGNSARGTMDGGRRIGLGRTLVRSPTRRGAGHPAPFLCICELLYGSTGRTGQPGADTDRGGCRATPGPFPPVGRGAPLQPFAIASRRCPTVLEAVKRRLGAGFAKESSGF